MRRSLTWIEIQFVFRVLDENVGGGWSTWARQAVITKRMGGVKPQQKPISPGVQHECNQPSERKDCSYPTLATGIPRLDVVLQRLKRDLQIQEGDIPGMCFPLCRGTKGSLLPRCPSSALLPFLGEGSPTKMFGGLPEFLKDPSDHVGPSG